MNLQFTKFAAMPEEVIEKYASKVPDELVELWQQYGLGFLLDGYLKIINPEEYVEFVEATYFRGTNGVPLFVLYNQLINNPILRGDIITLVRLKMQQDYFETLDPKVAANMTK